MKTNQTHIDYFFSLKIKRIQFSTAEDIFALAGIGFAAVAALWASVNLIEVHIPKDMLHS
jgi:hypothetical protein